MLTYRLKRTFTSGELSPLLNDRTELTRVQDGCKSLLNSMVLSQGPTLRRSGFRFIFNLNSLGLDTAEPLIREEKFIFNELQAFVLIFFKHTSGVIRVVFATDNGLVVAGDPAITECPPGTPISPPLTPGQIIYLDMPSGWNIEEFDAAQSGDQLICTQSGLKPHAIERYSNTCWTVSALTFTMQPTDWDDTNGWPEKVTFHQQRLYFGANKIKRQTVWASRAGSFLDFTTGSEADKAFTFALDSGTQDKIKWLISGTALYIGTLGNEWTVIGGGQVAITGANVLSKRQSDNGSEPLRPLMVNSAVLYLERHGRIVNEFLYNLSYDSYDSSDLLVASNHLTEYFSLTDWDYQKSPDRIVWGIRQDGVLLGMTYQRQHKIAGWHRHTTEGEFRAVCCIPGQGREDEVWVVVQREIQGTQVFYLEKMAERFQGPSAEWGRFLDSYLTYEGAPTDTVSGLDHLEGWTVGILTDGSTHPARTVVGGSITLDDEYSNIVVGLNYMSEVWPFLAEIGSQEGTTVGRVQQVIGLGIDFYETLGGWIGRYDREDGEKEQELPFRVPGDIMGQQIPLYTGIYPTDYIEGYDRETNYFIRQYEPLPMTIRGIVDLVKITE